VVQAVPVSEADRFDGTAGLRRAVADAYEQLADRVLARLRSVGEEIDADLAELRSEVSALRGSIEDLGDRVQLRQLRASVDAVRSDVAGLRRAIHEWPELEQVSSDISAIRAELASAEPRAAAAAAGGDGLAGLAAEVAAVRAEVAALRRRIPLRADAGPSIDDELVQRIAAAVAAHLSSGRGPRRRP
jgi:chromosome segregation ATPase